jgi:hypothetical protein
MQTGFYRAADVDLVKDDHRQLSWLRIATWAGACVVSVALWAGLINVGLRALIVVAH